MKATSSENVSGVQNMESIDELFLLVRDALDTADQADAMYGNFDIILSIHRAFLSSIRHPNVPRMVCSTWCVC